MTSENLGHDYADTETLDRIEAEFRRTVHWAATNIGRQITEAYKALGAEQAAASLTPEPYSFY
jgi:hypothetical protein